MKRLPLLVSFLLFIALCASIAYWALQLFKPPLRPVAAPPRAAQVEVSPDAAAALFGGRPGKAAVASNYQLRGVIMAGPRDSVAIISADGKPAQAVRVGAEMSPGVSVKEVQRDYVLLSDGGATKRVELPESAKGLPAIASAAPVTARSATPPPVQGITPPSAQPSARSQSMPPAAFQQPTPPSAPPVPPATVVPPAQPPSPTMPQSQATPQAVSPTTVTQLAPPSVVVSPSSSVQSSGSSASGSNGAAGAPVPQNQGIPAQQAPSSAPATTGVTPGARTLTYGETPLQSR